MALRTCNYVEVLNGSADLCGLDRDNLASVDFKQLRQAHDRRLQTAWEFDLWPELLRAEKRYYRDLYATATAYTASTATSATEVYFPSSGKYYQNVKASTGVDPANAAGTVNSTNWAESQTSYSASNFGTTTTYAVGDKVYYPTTDRYYVMHTVGGGFPVPTTTTNWGILTEFDRYIAYSQTGKTAIGSVFEVADKGDRYTTRSQTDAWFLSENGIQINTPSAYAWVTYRIRTVRLTGELFSATATYSVGNQVYYSATGTPGNFYDCITSTSAGETPVSAPTKWSVTSIPLIFQRYLELGGYSDWLRNTGQIEKALQEEQVAMALLADQSQLLVGQQRQTSRPLVSTR